MTRPNPTTRQPPPPDIPLRVCADCGRELFSLPGEGLGWDDDNLCTDCADGGLEQEFVA